MKGDKSLTRGGSQNEKGGIGGSEHRQLRGGLLYRVPEKVARVGGAERLGIGVCKAWLPQTVGSAELWPGGGTQEFAFHASSRVLPVLRSGAPL